MILADDILAARGSQFDQFTSGALSNLGAAIKGAKRFVLGDDVAVSAHRVMETKPTSFLKAMPMCRIPFQSMWIEWDGEAAVKAGWNLYPGTEHARESKRTTPQKIGCLIEAIGDSRRAGRMTWAWKHHGYSAGEIELSGLSALFDWRDDGDVTTLATTRVPPSLVSIADTMRDRWASRDSISDETVSQAYWFNKVPRSREQLDAAKDLCRRTASWFSPHTVNFVETVLRHEGADTFVRMMHAWEGDIAGEEPFMEAFLMMLNSKNAVEVSQEIDHVKLNKARAKRGKPGFLSHSVLRLHQSRTTTNRMRAAGIVGRLSPGEHDVMGHFKVRATGVYWWTDFSRGDPTRPVQRRHYEVR